MQASTRAHVTNSRIWELRCLWRQRKTLRFEEISVQSVAVARVTTRNGQSSCRRQADPSGEFVSFQHAGYSAVADIATFIQPCNLTSNPLPHEAKTVRGSGSSPGLRMTRRSPYAQSFSTLHAPCGNHSRFGARSFTCSARSALGSG